MGNARYTCTEGDMIAAQRAWWMGAARWQTVSTTAAAIGILYAAIVAFALQQGRQGWSWVDLIQEVLMIAVPAAIAVTAILLLVGYLKVARVARRDFREHKVMQGEFRVDWDDQAITIEHPSGKGVLPWTVFHGWLEAQDMLLLYQTRRLFNFLPKRALPEGAVEEIIGRLRAAGVPEKKRFGLFFARR